MKKKPWFILAVMITLLGSCSRTTSNATASEEPNQVQKDLTEKGWTFENPEGGDLSEKYGVKPVFGIQDNYFDIHIGEGFSVAIKIMDANTSKCIRYVFVPEGETITTTQIPQGRYFLKLAYGKDWMESSEGGAIRGKFTRSPFFERSTSCYDFGKKNSQGFVNYSLELNVINGDLEQNFETETISETEFDLN